MGPAPAVADTRRAVRAHLAALAPGDLVLVACSGGADSLALAAAVAFEAPRVGLRAGAVTVDHQLQEGSRRRAADVVDICRGLGLAPVEAVAVDVGEDGGPEAAARAARYDALDAAALRHGAAAVLLGHTRDDQAETVLLGLARGSGARSLAGMAPTGGPGGHYRRPFLDLPRATTRAACDALGLRPWDDPHNTDTSYMRVRVRTRALPVLEETLGPGVAAALARTARLLRADADALDAWATRAGADVQAPGGGLDVGRLATLPPAIRRRVLLAAALGAGCPGGALSASHVEAIDALVTDWHGQLGVDLPGQIVARRRYGTLYLEPGTGVDHLGEAVDRGDIADEIDEILLDEKRIATRIEELAAEIDADYAGTDLLLVGVLKGAVMVMADLARAMHLPVSLDFMAVSSYGSGTRSSGVVRILKDLDTDIGGRHVVLVEDIIDSGLTLSWLLRNLRSRNPASVEVCALMRKPDALHVDVPVRYLGFDLPALFVVGYGLDHDERYRNLPFVATLRGERTN